MKRVTQPVGARRTMLSAVAVVAALAASLVLAPLASATSDPVASGTTTVTLNKGLFKKLKKYGIKVVKVSPGTVKSRTVTLPVASGSMDPTNGLGSLELSGGFKFKAGKKQAPVNALFLETATSSLKGKVAGKQMKVASVAGLTYVRNGFGVNVSVAKLKLTGKAAKQLNKKLGFAGKKKSSAKGKSNKRAAASKATQPPFKGNQVLGSSTSETQPKTVAVLATGETTLVLSPTALKKIKNVGPEFPPASGEHPFEVKLTPIDPTKVVSLSPLTAAFPITGGTMGPTATTGILQTAGGLQLTQNLEALGPNGKGETTLKMGNIWVDMGAKTATVEVTIENPKTQEANLGNLGRSSIADISLTGATVTSDPTARTVSVQNASATLQAVTAETLNSVFITPIEKATGLPQEKFAAGDPLGTFSFTAHTQ
jgi:Htaa protein